MEEDSWKLRHDTHTADWSFERPNFTIRRTTLKRPQI